MRSFATIINTTAGSITVCGITFAVGVPCTVYRDQRLFGGDEFGLFTLHLGTGALVAYTYDDIQLSGDEAISIANVLSNFISSAPPACSEGWHWRLASCEELLDILRGSLLAFDWEASGVTKSQKQVFGKLEQTIAFLSASFLESAVFALDDVKDDSDDDYLSPQRLTMLRAMFASAAHD